MTKNDKIIFGDISVEIGFRECPAARGGEGVEVGWGGRPQRGLGCGGGPWGSVRA